MNYARGVAREGAAVVAELRCATCFFFGGCSVPGGFSAVASDFLRASVAKSVKKSVTGKKKTVAMSEKNRSVCPT